MIINNKRRKVYLLAALPLSVIVAYIFVRIAPFFKSHPTPAELTVFMEFLCGVFFLVAGSRERPPHSFAPGRS